jgi:hypothetical protein
MISLFPAIIRRTFPLINPIEGIKEGMCAHITNWHSSLLDDASFICILQIGASWTFWITGPSQLEDQEEFN